MATTELGFSVFALDRASKTFLSLAANVDRLSRKLNELDRKRANPKVDVDTKKAHAQLQALERRLDKLARGRTLINVAAAAAPLAVPAAAGALAAGGGIGAIGVAGLAGVGGFAAIAAAQLKVIKDTMKEAQDLAEDGHQKAAQRVLDQLSKGQMKVADSLTRLKAAWADFLSTGGGKSVLGPLAAGMGLLEKSLPAVGRFMKPVSESFAAMFDILGDSVASRGFRDFADTLGDFSAGIVAKAIGAAMNLARAFGNLFEAFMPLGSSMASGFVELTARFAEWSATVGRSDGFRKFMDYVARTGPQLMSTLGSIVEAFISVGKAMAPLAAGMLRGVQVFARWLARTAEAHPELIELAGAIAVASSAVAAIAGPLSKVAGLFALLGSGPVGIVVGAIAALGAGMVVAYRKSETFRNMVKSVAGWVRDDLFPALTKLKNAALDGLQGAWDNVRKSMGENRGLMRIMGDLAGKLGKVITDVVIPGMSWWVRNVWPALGKAIGIGITGVRVYITGLLRMVEVGAKAFRLLFQAATFAFDKILKGAAAALGWIPGWGDKIRQARDVFDKFRDGTIDGLDRIGDAARRMREAINRPAFVEVRTDKANGQIQRFITTTQGKFRDLGNDVYAITVKGNSGFGRIPEGMATGGAVRGPGTGTSDDIPALLSNGEHVLTAEEVRKAGGHRGVFAIRRMLKRGEFAKRGDVPAFADGGPVTDMPTVSVRTELSPLYSMVAGLVKRIEQMMSFGGGVPLGPGGTLSAGQVAMGQRFAQAQAGKPYVWSGVGPGGYDCSGFVGAVLNAALGRNPYSRLGSTGTMPWAGFRPGLGMFSAGWFTGSPGHMAGNIGGLGIESAGGVGVRLGGAATGVTTFPNVAHFDRGGRLRPGTTVAQNDSGQDELVLTHKEIKALSKAFRLGKNMTRGEVNSEFKELLRSLRDNLGKDAPLVKRVERMADVTLLSMEKTERLRRSLEESKQSLSNARGNMRDLEKSTASFYGAALFGEGQGLEAFGNAKQLASGAKAFERHLRKLDRMGLSDSLLAQIASSTDFDSAAALADASPAQIRRLNRLNNIRMRAARSVGDFAGRAVFGDDVREARRDVNDVRNAMEKRERRLDRREDRVEKAMERGLKKGLDGARLVLRDRDGRDRDVELRLRLGV